MKKFLLPETGNYYKANLHCHTNISDGNLTPEEMKNTPLSPKISTMTAHWWCVLRMAEEKRFARAKSASAPNLWQQACLLQSRTDNGCSNRNGDDF